MQCFINVVKIDERFMQSFVTEVRKLFDGLCSAHYASQVASSWLSLRPFSISSLCWQPLRASLVAESRRNINRVRHRDSSTAANCQGAYLNARVAWWWWEKENVALVWGLLQEWEWGWGFEARTIATICHHSSSARVCEYPMCDSLSEPPDRHTGPASACH